MKTVLCVDDDTLIQETISGYLEEEGFTVLKAMDEASALEAMKAELPNIILLDLILEKSSGLDFLKNITEDHPQIPIIMMSSRGEDIDKIIGLEAGADDYLAKPFHPRELSARIKAVLKRCQSVDDSEASTSNLIHFGDWILDIKSYQVFAQKGGKSAGLTTKEFLVLKELIMNKERVLTRDQIFLLFRDYTEDIYDRVVDIQISRIRSKLNDTARNPKYIKTIRDVGYTFICDTQVQEKGQNL